MFRSYTPRRAYLNTSKRSALVRSRPQLESLEDRNLLSGTYLETDLVSNIPGRAAVTDTNLQNPWGLVASPMGPWWVSDNGTGLSTLYDGSGAVQSLVVTIPPPMGSPEGTTSTPTGIVFNGGGGFNVSNGTTSGSSVFIFSTEDGTIAGWSPSVDLHNAFLPVDPPNNTAIYKGLAIGSNDSGTFIYATNFHDARIDVFHSNLHPAHLSGSFTDRPIPNGTH